MAKQVTRGKSAKAKTTAASVAERAMPGWKAVEPSGPMRSFGAAADSAASEKAGVDAVMPSTEVLHKKFFGSDALDAPVPPQPTKVLGDNISVVEMRSGDLRKSVGVNEQTKKVEWSQG